MGIREQISLGRARAAEEKTKREALRRLPQRAVSPLEYGAYAVLPGLLVMAGAMPSTALFVMPVILPLLYLLFRRFGALLPLACVCFYGLFSLVLNYDILSVIYFIFLFFAIVGLMAAVQLKPFLLCVAVAAITAVVGGYVALGVVRLAEGKPLADIASDYVIAEYDDGFISYMAHSSYDAADIPADIGKLARGDEGYEAAVLKYFAEYMHDDAELYAPYYCLHHFGMIAILAYFIAVAVNRRTASAYDRDADAGYIAAGTRCLGGVLPELMPIGSMRFPRAYIWTVMLPGFITSVVFDFIGGYEVMSALLMHAAVTLPTAIAFVTLMAYFASLFRGRARVAAYAVFFALMAAMYIFPIALYIGSILGMCDIILNLRFWTEFLRSD